MSLQSPHIVNEDVEDPVMILEFDRMDFARSKVWARSNVNRNYSICKSYPEIVILPAGIGDGDVAKIATFRSSERFPSVVWRNKHNGAVLARSSQPLVGLLGWRNSTDEHFMLALLEACTRDRRRLFKEKGSGNATGELSRQQLLVVDARSYPAALANRAKGGGCESKEYYTNCEIQFMNLPNIHSVRKSFKAVCGLLNSSVDNASFLSALESTLWMNYLSLLLESACQVANVLQNGRPVLVHCSDGWDRTPQITSLAQLMLDPFYRTRKGFQILIQKEWLAYGHRFGTRCGHRIGTENPSQISPVFLQWLDCVHQLMLQYPSDFEFSEALLVKLGLHVYSCLFGEFLWDNDRERKRESTQPLSSIWTFLAKKQFYNPFYMRNDSAILVDPCVGRLRLWIDFYRNTYCGFNCRPAKTVSQFESSSLGDRNVGQLVRSKSETDMMMTHSARDESKPKFPNPSAVAPSAPQLTASIGSVVSVVKWIGGYRNAVRAPSVLEEPAVAPTAPPYNPALHSFGESLSTTPNGSLLHHCDYDGLVRVVDPLVSIFFSKSKNLERENGRLRREIERLQREVNGVNGGYSRAYDDQDSGSTESESSPIDSSPWEAVDKDEATPTRWVPDHAQTRCSGCHAYFWLAKRRHHCRSCGKLFCHYCSDHYHPVPSEQLYEPVRVCKVCYDKLGGYHDESVKNGVEH
ncbi:myotubularin-related protein 4-like isoform X3 [Oscarella lobularis]